ncbi:TetR/AcrR family transcriptional regulator [Streptomyces sp. GQFP]|uniref:TetR/AcrR family transcriptional regulator n=1 Tax=Streptomyces sp. GQFP TaxID=2907545 RepID=UPI001F1E8190|nr:TetR/AcrR family transcriptional regulator [Streptomyces sp. GQFP]UIX32958.1 TetR/AcrR family transcriptional regulator [Streptomyces sp. GQFP]
MAEIGLRERKKRQTYQNVSDIAIGLFLEKGFDAVSVAEIAAAAGISKPTLFRYFPAKEDLVVHRFADHEDEAARVVRAACAGAGAGTSPVDALRRRFLDGLSREDPVTGLNDAPGVLAFHGLLYGTPSLVARAYEYQQRSEAALACALGGTLAARLAAGQIIAVQRILAQENWRRIAAGEAVEAVRGDAVEAAEAAFGQLDAGLPWLRAVGVGSGGVGNATDKTG